MGRRALRPDNQGPPPSGVVKEGKAAPRRAPSLSALAFPCAEGYNKKMSLLVRFIIIVSVVVTIVDVCVFLAVRRHPKRFTLSLLILMIIGTIIPIAINLWRWLR
jgi:hypothetical protein